MVLDRYKLENSLLDLLDTHPRRVLTGITAICLGMLVFGLYLQHVVGLQPCPMCIVQRYILMALAGVTAWMAWRHKPQAGALRQLLPWLVVLLLAGFGAFVAGRQSWLQWYPPEVVSCGRDFYGMVENLPLKRALPMIFAGSGDCTKVDWAFLGLSIANWAYLFFGAVLILSLRQLWQILRNASRKEQ